MAGHRGIEPLLLDLESNVLPLTLMTYWLPELDSNQRQGD